MSIDPVGLVAAPIVDSERRESTKSAAELKITTRDNYNLILAISQYRYNIVNHKDRY